VKGEFFWIIIHIDFKLHYFYGIVNKYHSIFLKTKPNKIITRRSKMRLRIENFSLTQTNNKLVITLKMNEDVCAIEDFALDSIIQLDDYTGLKGIMHTEGDGSSKYITIEFNTKNMQSSIGFDLTALNEILAHNVKSDNDGAHFQDNWSKQANIQFKLAEHSTYIDNIGASLTEPAYHSDKSTDSSTPYHNELGVSDVFPEVKAVDDIIKGKSAGEIANDALKIVPVVGAVKHIIEGGNVGEVANDALKIMPVVGVVKHIIEGDNVGEAVNKVIDSIPAVSTLEHIFDGGIL